MKMFVPLLARLALRQRVDVDPGWAERLSSLADEDTGPGALAKACAALGWTPPRELAKLPKAHQFPLLVYGEKQGWALAEQWHGAGAVRVTTPIGPDTWAAEGDALRFFEVRARGKRSEVPRQAFGIFLRALLSRKRMLVEATVATAMVSFVSLGVSLFAMQVYDRVIPQGGLSTLWVLMLGVLLAVSVEFTLRWLRSVLLEREAASIDAEVSEQFFSRLQAQRLDVRPPSVGTLAAQMRGLEQVRAAMSATSVYFVADLPFALFMIWVVYQIGGSIALVPAIAFPIVLVFAWAVARVVRRETKSAQASSYRKNGLLVETIAATEVIKATRGHWDLLARWNTLVEQLTSDDERVRRWAALSQSAANTVQQVVYVVMVAWGSLSVIEGEITMGALIACAIIAGRINGPLLSQLPALITQWSYARSALEGLDQLLAVPVDREPDGDYLRPSTLSGALTLDSVRFAYPGARVGLDIPKLEIQAGERVVVIGPVGSGKSTLLKILAGLFVPQQGTILIGGLDMQQISDDTLREHVGYLPQDYRLVQGTLRDNLLLGIGDPGDDALLARAVETGLGQVIAAHPKGLDLPISEGGVGLSGGQRQLVGLTRLLLAKPSVMLLDEPTAALDQESEKRVLQAFERAAADGSTIVMVTHKMPLVQLATRVIVVAAGRVVLDGPTATVLERLRRAAFGAAASAATPVAAAAGGKNA